MIDLEKQKKTARDLVIEKDFGKVRPTRKDLNLERHLDFVKVIQNYSG